MPWLVLNEPDEVGKIPPVHSIAGFERFAVIAFTFTYVTRYIDIRQKVHFDFD